MIRRCRSDKKIASPTYQDGIVHRTHAGFKFSIKEFPKTGIVLVCEVVRLDLVQVAAKHVIGIRRGQQPQYVEPKIGNIGITQNGMDTMPQRTIQHTNAVMMTEASPRPNLELEIESHLHSHNANARSRFSLGPLNMVLAKESLGEAGTGVVVKLHVMARWCRYAEAAVAGEARHHRQIIGRIEAWSDRPRWIGLGPGPSPSPSSEALGRCHRR